MMLCTRGHCVRYLYVLYIVLVMTHTCKSKNEEHDDLKQEQGQQERKLENWKQTDKKLVGIAPGWGKGKSGKQNRQQRGKKKQTVGGERIVDCHWLRIYPYKNICRNSSGLSKPWEVNELIYPTPSFHFSYLLVYQFLHQAKWCSLITNTWQLLLCACSGSPHNAPVWSSNMQQFRTCHGWWECSPGLFFPFGLWLIKAMMIMYLAYCFYVKL